MAGPAPTRRRRAPGPPMELDLLALLAVALGLGTATAVLLLRRRWRQRRDTAAWERNVEKRLHEPASLHPVIDTDVCIGSLSCIRACPEGDILGVVGGAARLVHAANCIGHGRCAAECPVGAIRLVFGTSERGVDLPEVDEFFESSRPGVHVVGELGGMGLIRNAVTQGLQVAEHLHRVLAAPAVAAAEPVAGGAGVPLRVPGGGPPDPGAVDVVVVGAGPAGLATASALRRAGRTVRILEQGTMGGTVAQYPRHKVVMTDPLELPYAGKLAKRLVAKEELIDFFQRLRERSGLRVEEGAKVVGIDGGDGAFRVRTAAGATVSARKVVLACGRRGTPRKLGCPGEALPKVTYRLLDPEQYAGAKVLVVGGGDSALEAANSLCDAGAEVAISYRGPEFGRCRPANKEGLEARAAAGKLRAVMASTVERIGEREVALRTAAGTLDLPNDYVIVLIGGELPLEFLKQVGVGVKRLHGEAPVGSGTGEAKRGPSKEEREARGRRRLAVLLGSLGASIVALLAWYGHGYYLLDPAARREAEDLHRVFRPAGTWGHGIGIVATAFMMSNFLYAVRKRWGRLKRSGTIRTWLTFHMFVGFMSPVVIAFHAAFQSNNGLATATAASLAVVVSTGIVGRFIYGMVPVSGGKTVELHDLLARWERERDALRPALAPGADASRVDELVGRITAAPAGGSLLTLFARLPGETVGLRFSLARLRPLFADAAAHREFRAELLRLVRLRRQVGFYRGLKRLLSGWRLFHASLAVFLVLLIAAHIGVALYLGYGWTFK
jgi:thioredoxin reductase/NAD-dependent dihydropyrimidine dehydrogenase PreA subunit